MDKIERAWWLSAIPLVGFDVFMSLVYGNIIIGALVWMLIGCYVLRRERNDRL